MNLTVSPKCGRLLLFQNLDKQGRCHPLSLHRALPPPRSPSRRTPLPLKAVVQKWVYRGCFGPDSNSRLDAEQDGPHVVVCDSSGSCRWYVHFA
jgi:hypothetical protein